MASNPHNQAEVATRMMEGKKRQIRDLLESEGEALEFLNWAELPMTKKVRESFKIKERGLDKELKTQKWKTEAEGRGLCYLCTYLGLLENMIEYYKDKHRKIQNIKQKEAKQ